MEVKVIGQMDNTIDHTFESANRVYDDKGLSPTINCCGGGGLQPKIIVKEPRVLGGLGNKKSNNGTQYYQQDRVYSSDGIAMCHPANIPGGSYKYMIDETKTIVAMRGRNPDNPSDRTPGIKTEQRLEPNRSGVCNTLTSVQKDNMVLEQMKIKRVGNISSDGSQCGTVLSVDGLSGTLSAGTHGYANNHICEKVKALDEQNMCIRNGTLTTDGSSPKHNNRVLIKQDTKQGGVADLSYPDSKIESPYRIRKLTPLECWRLMGFTDDEFGAAESVNSNTQLYKQAGNSIVVDVLASLFNNIFEALEEEEMKKVEEIKTGKF